MASSAGATEKGDRHRPGVIRSNRRTRPGRGRDQLGAVTEHTFGVGAIERETGEKLGRHATALTCVVLAT